MDDVKIKALSGFERYAFADSITVTGDFSSLLTLSFEVTSISDERWPDYDIYTKNGGIYVKVDKLSPPTAGTTYYRVAEYNTTVRNCNFNFHSDNVTTESIDGMFDGCINAVFSSRLSIPVDSSVTSASKTFRNCWSAKLPVVDIGESNISSCDRMFENCYAAELCGAQIPCNATMFDGMFRNAKSAFFNDIAHIPYGNGNYHELFSGCENGVFQNLEFSEDIKNKLDCGFMFYYCGNMDCGNLGFDRISRYVTDAGYMFYSAGSNGSKTFDDGIYDFSSLTGCECAFTKSNFSFDNSYFRFDGNGEINGNLMTTSTITSISRMFSGCTYCEDVSPVVILGRPATGNFELSSIDSQLNGRLYGHYVDSTKNCLFDFSSLYEGSNIKTLELRGISNNGVLVSNGIGCVQDFASMCKDCENLEKIVGYLPPCASRYDDMFSGCTSLSANLSKLFKTQSYGWSVMDKLDNSFKNDNEFQSYSMTSIRGMFEDCGYIYSTRDDFDMVGLFKTVERNLVQKGHNSLQDALDSIKDSLPPIRLATRNPIPELSDVRYVLDGISSNTGTVRYNSFKDDPVDVEKDDNATTSSKYYGIYSEYAKSAFGRGFYRYGGEFLGDGNGRRFFIIFHPERDDVTGDVVGFTSDAIDHHVNLRPHGWGELFNMDRSKGYWNEFIYDKVYPGVVCEADGTFVKFAYIGSYTRIYHEIRGGDAGRYEYVAKYGMPVTYFDGYEDSIEPL